MLLCGGHHRLVHEGGYAIRKDHQGRWYFMRPDGRAIPRYGYQPDDMVDEGLDMDSGGASAEAPIVDFVLQRSSIVAPAQSRQWLKHYPDSPSLRGFKHWSTVWGQQW